MSFLTVLRADGRRAACRPDRHRGRGAVHARYRAPFGRAFRVQFHGFLHRLLADPRLAGKVNDIVVEAGNPLYQDIVDRYAAGEDVSVEEVSQAWRNSSQILVWDSPLYEEMFRWVRTVNSGLPAAKRYRIVLMEPRIDWTKVDSKADYEPFAQRSRDQLARVESEVLAKHRKAIVVVGGGHVVRRSMGAPKDTVALDRAGLGDALGRKYPGRTFAVWTVPGGSVLASEFAATATPSILVLSGTPLAARSFGDAAPGGMMVRRIVQGKQEWVELTSSDWPTLDKMADALLFLGTVRTKAEAPQSVYADTLYYNEVLRRARIMSDVFGMDMTSMVREAAGKDR